MDKLEDAFIAYLEDAAATEPASRAEQDRGTSRTDPARGLAGVCGPGGSICAGCGPMRGGKRWKSCVIRSGSLSRSLAR